MTVSNTKVVSSFPQWFCKGFTLIELLVAIMIIGILAAVAVPQYQKAVYKSRYNAMMPVAKTMADANELYYAEHSQYASRQQDLSITRQADAPDGTQIEFGNDPEYAYVIASNPLLQNNYIRYQQHSENYPGEVHCEALDNNDRAQWLCEKALSGRKIGNTLTEGYTTYVLEGDGAGLAPEAAAEAANDNAASCDKATEMGYACTLTEHEDGTKSKRVCYTDIYCITYDFNADDKLTTKASCQMSGDECTNRQIKNYDENGNVISRYSCNGVKPNGDCSQYYMGYFYAYDANGNLTSVRKCRPREGGESCGSYEFTSPSNHFDYTYDENGNLLRALACYQVASNGSCSQYSGNPGSYYYTYDENGKMTSQRYCGKVNTSDGSCKEYASSNSNNRDYIYDSNGNVIRSRYCKTVASDGSCSTYPGYDYYYTYDENGKMTSQRYCATVAANGSCSEYATTGNYDYTYDTNGNQTSNLNCRTVAANGSCSKYDSSDNHYYTYDVNGNLASERECYTIASDGSCSAYSNSGPYNYIYDENGYLTNKLTCWTVAPDGSCNEYVSNWVYINDEDGKQVNAKNCSYSQINTDTGECISYNTNGNFYLPD